jgi:hypothetical protein
MKTFTFHIDAIPGPIHILDAALNTWKQVADVDFAEGDGGFTFTSASGSKVGIPPQTAAVTAGRITTFNTDWPWTDDLFARVACHEIGHLLGLSHSWRPGAVMHEKAPMAAPQVDDDIPRIQAMYGYSGPTISGSVAPGINNALPISINLPIIIEVGKPLVGWIVLKNIGSTVWDAFSARNAYHLGSASPNDNTVWGVSRFSLPSSVRPGEMVTIPVAVKAPQQPGLYSCNWNMVQEWVEWFAGYPVQCLVNVVPAAVPAAAPAPPVLSVLSGPPNDLVVTINGQRWRCLSWQQL